MVREDNPIHAVDEAASNPETYEEAYYNDEQAYALYDTYMMLLDAGFEPDACRGIRTAIDELTIFNAEGAEELYEEFVKEE